MSALEHDVVRCREAPVAVAEELRELRAKVALKVLAAERRIQFRVKGTDNGEQFKEIPEGDREDWQDHGLRKRVGQDARS